MILLITPPLSSLNTPYPATTALTALLKARGHMVEQMDLGIELLERVLSHEFLELLFEKTFDKEHLSKGAQQIGAQKSQYINTIDSVMEFLRGGNQTLATRIVSGTFLPCGPRLAAADSTDTAQEQLDWAFGMAGTVDRAKHLATLYLEDITDLISEVITPEFSLVRYGEQLALSAPTFDKLHGELQRPMNEIEELTIEILDQRLKALNPTIVGFTIPFPGSLLSALQCAQRIKQSPNAPQIVLGGGYINTELRNMSDPRIFDHVDFITFDDGELPLLRIVEQGQLVRTIWRDDQTGRVTKLVDSLENIPFAELPPPTFCGLRFDKYFSTITLTNPMHKLWSDGFWNKLTMAHGCYWGKCTFCDTSLDYILRYEAPSATVVVDRMESIIGETGQSGFHFTDEALPPKLLKDVCHEILNRGLVVSFWGNIRFERNFDKEFCSLLSRAGCIAVSGGIEVASPDILKMINKGITIQSLSQTLESFADCGIMVHAYLMYGFPTQTLAQTIESLDVVRDFFARGLLQSAFWHRYTMTIHSKTGICPAEFSARRTSDTINKFANNGVDFLELNPTGVDWEMAGEALSRATYNYMHFNCLEQRAKSWFRTK